MSASQAIHDEPVIAAASADVYYKGGYWNSYDVVVTEINRRVSGRPDRGYVDAFRDVVAQRRFARALFINCGNGWVEREMFQRGVFDEGVGIDFSDELLEQARANATGLPISYHRVDINEAVFPDRRYDLVVNYAAGHHVAYLDKLLRALANVLTPDGWFMNYDYIGPHRNQYPYEQWSAVWELNRRLPEEARQTLKYPHLPTMLATDPSEAIHSDLFFETWKRYFDVATFRPIGGTLAYPLLTFNEALARLAADRRDEIIRDVMREDERYVQMHPGSTLFAFWCGTPKKDVLSDEPFLARWTLDEEARESRAREAGGIYYPRTLLQELIYPEG